MIRAKIKNAIIMSRRYGQHLRFELMKRFGFTYYNKHVVDKPADELVSRERFVPEFQQEVLYAKMHFERYEFACRFLQPDDVVIDIACGAGYGSSILSKRCKKVIGVDRSAEAVRHSRSTHGIEAIVAEFNDYAGRGNVVASFETIEHIDAPLKKTLNKLVSLADRLVIGSVPYMEVPNNPYHRHFFIGPRHLEFLKKYGDLKIYFQEREPGYRIFENFIDNPQNMIFVLALKQKQS